jgi:glycolate oxidase FAD binding subunit
MAASDALSALTPASTAELAETLAADDRAVEPIGLGSKRSIGRSVDAIPLQLDRLTGVIDYRPAELVMTVMAGTPLIEIEALLDQSHQRFAFEPPDLGPLLGEGAGSKGTIGGVLATNLSGSRRIAAGAARDHFLGVTAVNGRGETFTGGGRVVKNVTGYDVPKLLAGSWGSLAVMSEVTLKTVPAPETELTMIVPDREHAAGVATLSQALGSAHEVTSAAFDPWRGSAIRLEGVSVSVDAREQALLEVLGNPDVERLEGGASRAYWQRLGGAEALKDWRVVWRISVPPSDAPRVIDAIEPERYLIDWGGGLIWAAYDRVDAARVRGALRDGHATLIKAPAGTRVCRMHPPSAALAAVLERVRYAFDPAGRLNPGRMD